MKLIDNEPANNGKSASIEFDSRLTSKMEMPAFIRSMRTASKILKK